MDIGKTLDVATAAQWRAWLEANHALQPEIWLVFHSKASGVPTLAYNNAVEEALCFGWIDSVNKKFGEQSRVQRFTPRRLGSKFSEMNKARLRRLVEDGRMTPAGLAGAGDVLDEPFVLAQDIVARLRADPQTWHNFEAFPDSYRRIRIGFIEAARNRPDVFETRLAYFIKMTAQNKRYGMVQ